MTTVSRDDESRKKYTAHVGRYNQLKTFEESKCENEPLKVLPHVEETKKLSKKEPRKKAVKKPKSSLIIPSTSISKKKPIKKPANKQKRL